MRYSIRTYTVIAVISFAILSIVQTFLVFNTYQLENERYFFSDKSSVNAYYTKLITNDKVYPGGTKIIDSILNRNIPRLEDLYYKAPEQFAKEKQLVCDSIFTLLRQHQNIDKIIADFKKENGIKDSLQFASTIELLDFMMNNGNYVSLYHKNEQYPLLNKDYQLKDGIRIAGDLKETVTQNRATWLSVSIPSPHSYKIIFALYVDNYKRTTMVVAKMMPTLVLSLISLLINVSLFYITFRNWLKQKKLTEMKTDFINSITHEFNTPIAAITVANKSLQNEKINEKRENIVSLTGVIQRQTGRLQKLVSQVLDLTTLNHLTLQKEPHPMHHLLDEILLDYKINLGDKEVVIHLRKEASQDEVQLDKFYFTTMLLNLLDNAVKYNSQKIKVINISTSNNKKSIQLTIQDNGIGMTDEIKKNIFKKFYRNVNSDMEQVTGLGLGLYYVKQSVDAHGWNLFVGSTLGEGTTFIISMPYNV